jgi:hypothetical protein
MEDIFSGETLSSKEFLKNIRCYNSRFAFELIVDLPLQVLELGMSQFRVEVRPHSKSMGGCII